MSEVMKTTTIQTQRLTLRPMTMEDIEAFYELRSYPEIYRWSLLGRYKDISQAETWVTENLRGSNNFSFMVELNEDDDKTDPINSSDQPLPRIIGSIGTPAKPELEPHQKVVREIGYMYRPDQWGKGYATESTQALIKALFEKTDVTHVIARTDSENYGSWKVLEKCGFKRVDTADYDNVTLGKRTVLHYEIARPGYAIKGEQ